MTAERARALLEPETAGRVQETGLRTKVFGA
jgi:hypothetical protein